MALSPSIVERRGEQMLPELDPLEIERVRRFGECRSFPKGAALYTIGQVSPGLMVILAGKVEVTHVDKYGHRTTIVTHGPGHFLGCLLYTSRRRPRLKHVMPGIRFYIWARLRGPECRADDSGI